MNEIVRICHRISPTIAQRLLEFDNHNFFRTLCQMQLKLDLKNVIELINQRKYVNCRERQKLFPLATLRENLRNYYEKVIWLFPVGVSTQNPILNKEEIVECIRNSFRFRRCFTSYKVIHAEMEMKTNSFLKKMEQRAMKQSKRPTRWKSIWDGHFLQLSLEKVRSTLFQFENRAYSATVDEVYDYLLIINDNLVIWEPEVRRNAMFRSIKFPYGGSGEASSISLFSKLVNSVYKFKKYDRNIEKLYSKLVLFFIDESIEYGVKQPILFELNKRTNNSPFQAILRTRNYPELCIRIIEEFGDILKTGSEEFQFQVLMKCMNIQVDIRIIEKLFKKELSTLQYFFMLQQMKN